MFNRDLFRAKCIEHGIRTQDAAQIMGINPATLSRKMVVSPTSPEMRFSCSGPHCILLRRRPMLFFSRELTFT